MAEPSEAARKAADEIRTLVYACNNDCMRCDGCSGADEAYAAIIERHFGDETSNKDKRIAELEEIALSFFRAAVASNRNYPGDLNLLVDIARHANLCSDTVEIHVYGTDVQIVGLKKEMPNHD